MDGERYYDVLLVEDNEDDVLITRKGFEKEKLPIRLHHVENGEKCLQFLRREGEYASAPTVDLILLDLNMPVMDGREALSEIVSDPDICHIPVVILTTSDAESDLHQMYRLRCSAYVVKPVDFTQFRTVVRTLFEHWFDIVALPPAPK